MNNGTSALQINQDSFSLVIIEKPVIAVGTIIHFKYSRIEAALPILKVIADPWGRDFEVYIVENPMWTVDSQFSPYMPLYSNSFMNRGYGATVELTAKHQLLIDAMNAQEMVHLYKKEARAFKPMAASVVTPQPIATSKGFGFHDEIESVWLEGNKAEVERCMAKAQEWQDIYNAKIEMYKSGKA